MAQLRQSAYLNKYDLISQYNFQNINHLPQISKIGISLKSWEYTASSKSDTKILAFDENSQIKSCLMLYTLNSLSPSIKYNQIMIGTNTQSPTKKTGYVLRSSITDKKSIQNILANLFIENASDTLAVNWNLKKFKIEESKITINIKIPFYLIREIENFGEYYLKDISLKNVNLYLDITIKNTIPNLNLNTLFPFWING